MIGEVSIGRKQYALIFSKWSVRITSGFDDMSFEDNKHSTAYFQGVANLAERLSKSRLAIYEHRYDFMAFGSWEIVAGQRRRKYCFTFDGKNSCLSYGSVSASDIDRKSFTDLHIAVAERDNLLNIVAEVLEKEFPN